MKIIKKGTIKNHGKLVELSEHIEDRELHLTEGDTKEEKILKIIIGRIEMYGYGSELIKSSIIIYNDSNDNRIVIKNHSQIPNEDILKIKTDEEIKANLLSYLISFCDEDFRCVECISEEKKQKLNDKINEFISKNDVYSFHFPIKYENVHLKAEIDWNGELKIQPKKKIERLDINVTITPSSVLK